MAGLCRAAQAPGSCEQQLSWGRSWCCRLLRQRCGGAASCRREVSCGAGPRCALRTSGGRDLVGAFEVRLLVEQGCVHSVWRWIEGLPRESAAVKPLGLGKWDSLGLFPALVLMGCVRG